MQRLAEHDWRAREAAHAERIDAMTAEYLAWRRRGDRHPVLDFLFDYYGHTPGKLRRWHPGPGVLLEGAAHTERAEWAHMRVEGDGVILDGVSFAAARATGIAFARRILARTLERPIQTGCFGLHEWAMVYRGTADRRHGSWPLRLAPEATDAVIDEGTLRCTHFDATRFFTPEALPRNELSPTRDTQEDFEQPGCLHAGMDLYRWALKLAPGLPSDLTADAFSLACEIRELDMRASPYDLSALGYEPVCIETADGRRDYAERQRAFGERGNALRRRMLPAVEALAAQGELATA
ncbi:MAG: hypothetical protein Q7T55_13260 [Solirubrobacteraceae bacterium]|nr:hypothetical protein [Solirubrobacteraceae bacterium]